MSKSIYLLIKIYSSELRNQGERIVLAIIIQKCPPTPNTHTHAHNFKLNLLCSLLKTHTYVVDTFHSSSWYLKCSKGRNGAAIWLTHSYCHPIAQLISVCINTTGFLLLVCKYCDYHNLPCPFMWGEISYGKQVGYLVVIECRRG